MWMLGRGPCDRKPGEDLSTMGGEGSTGEAAGVTFILGAGESTDG